MVPMAAKSSPVSLPWLWVTEALASFKQVDTSLLTDVIVRTPELLDNLDKDTREMVSLRCLESLFGQSNGIKNPSAPHLKSRFNFSQSCEDVLKHILSEMSTPNLKMVESELLKWDAHHFLMHKRTCLPKCALEQLKCTILEGTHPSAALLMERSGLAVRNECDDRTHSNDGDSSALSLMFGGSDTDRQVEEASGKLIAVISEIGNGILEEDSPNRNFLPFKRDREDTVEPSSENSGDLHLNPKKSKDASSLPIRIVGENLVPLQGNEQLEDSSGRTILATEREECYMAKESYVQGLKERRSSVNVGDESSFLKSIEQISDFNEVRHDQFQSFDINKLPQGTSGDGPCQNSLIGEANNDIEHCVGPKTSNGATQNGTQQKPSIATANPNSKDSFQLKTQTGASPFESNRRMFVNDAEDNRGHYCEGTPSSDGEGHDNEKINIATAKRNFLSSQGKASQDSLSTADWTEQNFCVKCNKEGQLLVCSAIGCPVVVHENCLDSSGCFDNGGNFYCPFCAYSLAFSEYLEAKKKASLARKALAAFIGMGIDHQKNKHSKRSLLEKGKNQSRQDGHSSLLVTGYGNRHLREELDSLVDHNEEPINQGDNHQTRETINAEPQDAPSVPGDNDTERQAKASMPCVKHYLSSREEEISVRGALSVSAEENQGEEVQEIQRVKGFEGQQNHVLDQECDNDNSSSRDKEPIIVSWRHSEAGTERDVIQQKVSDPPQEPSCGLNIDAEETSEDGKEKANYFIRVRKQEKHYTYPTIPLPRRKKVTWTAEEEEILKKGVKRFSCVGDKNVPWTKILEFGGSVFQKSRNPVDLKDKWRNMCKANQKSK